ncbi:von Willebrand factor A domain-containing protein 5A-like isoform X3 [Argonauta hians]
MNCPIIFGIICEKKTNVSLLYATHNISIDGFTAHVNIEAEYINESQHKTDAKFVFPVEEDSAVYKFEATIGDVHLVAKAKDKDVAQTEYKEAVEKGQSAILLRETSTSGDIFEYSLGNIPPKQKINLQICLVTELTCEVDGAVKFYMPFVLNPRYGLAPKDEKYQNAPKPKEFTFMASINWTHQIKDIKSEHPIKVEYQDNKMHAIVKMAKAFDFEKDLLLHIYYEDVEKPQVIFEKGDSQAKGMFPKDIMMINLFPKLPQGNDSQANDYIFVIDRSGSMNGEKIEAAKDTLLLFLKSLPLGSYFNVISFNNRFEFLFEDGSQEYNEDSLNKAIKFQKNLDASGGTEIFEALKSLSSKKLIENLHRQVFLITDGEVYNTKDVINLVKSQASNSRYFTIGIGSGASTELVKGIARAGNGKAEFVMTNDNLKSKVIRLLKLSMQQFVSHAKISAKDADSNKEFDFNSVPEKIPCIFTEETFILYLNFQQFESSCQKIKLNLFGKIGNSDFSLDFETNLLDRGKKENTIHRLCVRKKIQELEINEDVGKGDEIKSEIVELGTTANLVSRYTSFIGVDNAHFMDPMPLGAPMQNMCMPMVQAFMASPPACMPMPAACLAMPRARKTMQLACMPMKAVCAVSPVRDETYECLLDTEEDEMDSFESPHNSGSKHKDILTSLVDLQTFAGFWNLDDNLAQAVNISLKDLNSEIPLSIQGNVWATAVVIVVLREKLASQRCEWELMENKAKMWLESQKIQALNSKELLEKAAIFIKNKLC